jgi:flagellar biosynthetic protein FliR
MGYGIVNAIDTSSTSQISIIAETQYVLSILLFFIADIHHSVIAVIGKSFELIPPGGALIREGLTTFMMNLGTTLFAMSLQFAMPVIIIIFAINVSLGLIARAVPQINVFMESFPLRIIAGMSLLIIMLGILAGAWMDMFGGLDRLLATVVKLMAP